MRQLGCCHVIILDNCSIKHKLYLCIQYCTIYRLLFSCLHGNSNPQLFLLVKMGDSSVISQWFPNCAPQHLRVPQQIQGVASAMGCSSYGFFFLALLATTILDHENHAKSHVIYHGSIQEAGEKSPV